MIEDLKIWLGILMSKFRKLKTFQKYIFFPIRSVLRGVKVPFSLEKSKLCS